MAAKSASGSKHTTKAAGRRKVNSKAAAERTAPKATTARNTKAQRSVTKGSRNAAAGSAATNSSASAFAKTITPGRVYYVSERGVKQQRAHVAKKATAGQIRNTLGISKSRAKSVHAWLEDLTAKGRIPKS